MSWLSSAVFAHPIGNHASSAPGDLGRGFAKLLLIVTAVVAAIALMTSVSEAHDQAYCDDDGEDTHYVKDVIANPPGRLMMFASSSHDHLIVKDGGGVSGISVDKRSSNDFDYLGTAVSVQATENVFEITFTTSRADAIVKICFEDSLGLWYPYAVDVNGNPIGTSDTNFAPETRNLPIPRQDLEIDGGNQTVSLGTYF